MCSCEAKTSTSVTSAACGGGCESTVINPVVVTPITSTEEASNKYSIQTEIKPRNGSGSQSSTYTGQGVGETNDAIVASVHNHLVEVVVDIARSIIGEDYTGPVAFNGPTHLATLTAFQNYFSNAGSVDPDYVPVTNVTKKAQLDYISQVMYPLFLSVETHIEGSESSVVVCASGSSRVLKITIKNCLFCLTFIYN